MSVPIDGKPDRKIHIERAPNGRQGFGRVHLWNSLTLLETKDKNNTAGWVDGHSLYKPDIQLLRDENHVDRFVDDLGENEVWPRDGPRVVPYNPKKTFTATLVYPDPGAFLIQNEVSLVVYYGESILPSICCVCY